jgi:hypothetical protein
MGSSKLLDDEGAKGNGVPPIGHGLHNLQAPRAPGAGRDNQQAQNQGHWEQQRTLTSRTSNPNLQYSAGSYDASALPPNPPIPQQYLNQQQQQLHGAGQGPRMGVVSPFQGAQGQEQQQLPVGLQSPPPGSATNLQAAAGFITAMDVPTLIATKGYNPPTFDCKPAFVSIRSLNNLLSDRQCSDHNTTPNRNTDLFRTLRLNRLASSSSSHTRRTTCTSHSSMRFGAPRIREINASIRRSRTPPEKDRSTFSLASMLAGTFVVWRR